MSPNLEAALAAVNRGWFVWPARWDAEKKQHRGYVKWGAESSNDPEQVKRWAEQWPTAYFCLHLGLSRLAVVDIDDKNGKNGQETLAALVFDESLDFPDSFEVRTPSGSGYHVYFLDSENKVRPTVGTLGLGIDTRGRNSIVPVPGAIVPGKGRYTIKADKPLVAIPEWVPERLGQSRPRDLSREYPACELDTPENIRAAISVAVNAKPSIENDGGDNNAFRVANEVLDKGVSKEQCFGILLEFWNESCAPPWSFDDLEEKVLNAWNYRKSQVGCESPEAIKADFQDLGEDEAAKEEKSIPIRRMSELVFKDIPKRKWILGRRYLAGFVTLTIAPGGQGKSTLTMAEAAAIASGRPITGEEVHRTGKVWIYNIEDNQEELDRRVAALALEHGLEPEELGNIITTSGIDHPLIFVKDSKNGPLTNNKLMSEIIRIIQEEGVILFVIDPFVRCHRVSENDNGAIDKVALCLSVIASRTECAVGVVHHTRKGSAGSPGSADSARGASSLVSAARIAHTLSSMQKPEADALGIPENMMPWYVRLDDAKANLSPPGASTRWFERVSVALPNGEFTGTVRVVNVTNEQILNETEQDLVDAVFKYWSSPITVYEMAQELKKHAVGQSGVAASTIRHRLTKLFYGVRREREGIILTCYKGDGKKTKAYVICEADDSDYGSPVDE